MRSLAEAVAAGDDLEHALAGLTVPAGVKELVETRLARLSETAQQVLTVASVVGREFRLELLEELIDEPVERIIAALEEASATPGWWTRSPTTPIASCSRRRSCATRSTSARAAAAACACTTGSRRRSRSWTLGATPAELAHHFHESRHLDRAGQAVDYAVQAAETGGGRAGLRGGRRALPARARPLRRRGPAALRAAAGARRRRGASRRPARGGDVRPPPPSSPATASRSCSGRPRSAAPRAGRRAARSTARRSRGSRRRSRRSATAR